MTIIAASFCILMQAGSGRAAESPLIATYVYTLSNFTGDVTGAQESAVVDPVSDETYLLTPRGIKIFNDRGMETYSFNEGRELGNVVSVAIDEQGNIFALAIKDQRGQKSFEIIQCNYRGEPQSRLELKNVPEEFADLVPNTIILGKAGFYLANQDAMKAIVVDRTGLFLEGYDFAKILGFTEAERGNTGLYGFNVCADGSMLFTIGPLARAYIVSPDRTYRAWGKNGSAPGQFGVPGAIAEDASHRFILVCDILRCRVIVFDKNLKFNMEFGYRGYTPDGLVAPFGLAVDHTNRVYVTQMGNKGVSVFQVAAGG